MSRDDILVELTEALAEADGVERTTLDYTISDHMNPEVLAGLSEMDGGVWELAFRISDHYVRISHSGTISVDGVNYTTGATLRK